jgi:hypothetical protein
MVIVCGNAAGQESCCNALSCSGKLNKLQTAGDALQEEENMDLASRNAQLQQRIAELEALAEAAEAAAQAQQQQADSPEPTTPQHQRMGALGLNDEGASMQERATSVLKRAAAASRLSGMYEVRRNMHCVISTEQQLNRTAAAVTRRELPSLQQPIAQFNW